MGFFDDLHDNENQSIISREIDEYLRNLDYKEGKPCSGFHEENGLARWYCGDLYDTQVCIYRNQLFLYKDLNCGGYEGDATVDIPEEARSSLKDFRSFLNETFNGYSFLFDRVFQKDN